MTTTHITPEIWTKETFNPYFDKKYIKSKLDVNYGIMTLAQVTEKIENDRYTSLTTVSSIIDNVVMFVDDHCWGGWLGEKTETFGEREYFSALPSHFVPSTIGIPSKVEPRHGCEDGLINTVKKYLEVFHNRETVIESMDQLLHYLNVTRKEKIHYRKTNLSPPKERNVKVLLGTEPNDEGVRTCFKYMIRKTNYGDYSLFYKHGQLYRDGSSFFSYHSKWFLIDPNSRLSNNKDKRKVKRAYNRFMSNKIQHKHHHLSPHV